ncbi:addiction module protein [Flavilitoribacter nigricans]|uniref:Addiction module antitoxin RelB n=1 Tax=Flavilitoribacter nigricans (strain ATCC 23147 / DSM 23189 / NBRC 102662 / NCIMB 1420 / SS-2) TaxID=1122177 RepID=A0A2D0MXL5_FLAN2|nr:addiction module protein [Flavilitoribacter nigricans]PHN00920.1 hypothetical protein CRP01_39690 [Flavilitoribacter nigricans DSM 23189 = NBRC 102662]
MTVESLKAESLKLDKAGRKELAYFLLESIIETDEDFALELSPEQQAELERRMEAFEKGEMTFTPAKEVLSRIRGKHGLQH